MNSFLNPHAENVTLIPVVFLLFGSAWPAILRVHKLETVTSYMPQNLVLREKLCWVYVEWLLLLRLRLVVMLMLFSVLKIQLIL